MKISSFAAFLLLGISFWSCSGQAQKPVYSNDAFVWYPDSIRQEQYVSYAESNESIVSTYPSASGGSRIWKQKNDISVFGKYCGTGLFETALYNMAADELINNIEADSTLRTGALWSGVWTRDVSYSIILSLADLVCTEAEVSLMRKVDRLGRIIQDTGTGGSWPCSTDRMIWALAAWKVYLVTGDREWLENSYRIVSRSIEDDLKVVFDERTGLVKGESSFIDWREQSYPRWMQPVDIYGSECLGTNVVYHMVFRMMARAAEILGYGQDAEKYSAEAEKILKAVNDNLWMEEKGYYGQYLYGRDFPVLSPRSETLGESLAILSGVASPEKAERIVSSMAVSAYGPTIFWPQIKGEFNYHNNAIWPFVTSYYAFAAAKAGNSDAFLHAMASNVRAAAIYATNHENMVASDGSLGTALNSPNMLWSLSGMLGIFRHVLLGMDVREDGIAFSPFVPEQLKGERRLEGYKCRDLTLNISVEGYGSGIRKFILDGKVCEEAFVPFDLAGTHEVRIILDRKIGGTQVNIQPYTVSPDVPAVKAKGNALEWGEVENAALYRVYCQGEAVAETFGTIFNCPSSGEYSVSAVTGDGVESFVCEPLRIGGKSIEIPVKKVLNRGEGLELTVDVPESGEYAIGWKYANGSGCVTSYNMCATRSLFVDGNFIGASVFPQRGVGEWKNYGFSNHEPVYLEKGSHKIALRFLQANENMNIDVNKVVVVSLSLRTI